MPAGSGGQCNTAATVTGIWSWPAARRKTSSICVERAAPVDIRHIRQVQPYPADDLGICHSPTGSGGNYPFDRSSSAVDYGVYY
jgi:hypothetical protein